MSLDLNAIRERAKAIPRDNMSTSERDKVNLLAEVDRLTGERDVLKRGGAQLGRIIDRHVEWVLDATDMHDAIDEDGDGDWELIWEKLAALRPDRDQLQARLDKVRALHRKDYWTATMTAYCKECRGLGGGHILWPCPTIQALEGNDHE